MSPQALLERDDALAHVKQWAAEAASGAGRLVLVAGEAGIGKTSLVRAVQSATESRWAVGRSEGLFTPRPLGALIDIADALGGPLRERLVAGAAREELFGLALRELRASRPTVLVFEDLHWADEATLDLVRFLGRRLERTNGMVVATYRDDEETKTLQMALSDLVVLGIARRIRLDPLSPAGVAALNPGNAADAALVYALTGGNPYLASELFSSGDAAQPSATLRDVVLGRIANLPASARSLLDAASLVGATSSPDFLVRATGADDAAIEACVATGVIRWQEALLAFRHELARVVVDDAISPRRRRHLHQQILAALVADDGAANPGEVAHHADASGNGAIAYEFALVAAEQAEAVGARRQAAEHLGIALRWLKGPSSPRADLLKRRARLSWWTGDLAEAIEAAREETEIRDPDTDPVPYADALTRLGQLLFRAGRPGGTAMLEEAISRLAAVPPGPELAEAYAVLGGMYTSRQDAARAIEWSEKAVRLARELGLDATLSYALNSVGAALADTGRPEGFDHLDESLAIARARGLDEHVGRALINIAYVSLLAFRDYQRCDQFLAEGIAHAIRSEMEGRRAEFVALRARSSMEQGRWGDAVADATEVLASPNAGGIARAFALHARGRARLRRGDDGWRRDLDEGFAVAGLADEHQQRWPLRAARVESALIADEIDSARDEAAVALAELGSMTDLWARGELTVLLHRAGGAVPQADLDQLAEPWRLELAGKHELAAEVWEQLGCPFEAGVALARSASATSRRRALEIFVGLGARPAAAQLSRQLRASGMRDLPRGVQRATRLHPAGLTRREAEVLDLLERGQTNAEIGARLVVTPKTVEHHVSAILAKLGVAGRRDLLRPPSASNAPAIHET